MKKFKKLKKQVKQINELNEAIESINKTVDEIDKLTELLIASHKLNAELQMEEAAQIENKYLGGVDNAKSKTT